MGHILSRSTYCPKPTAQTSPKTRDTWASLASARLVLQRETHMLITIVLKRHLRMKPIVLAVTVTSCVGETNLPSVSPEEISGHPTGRLTGDGSLPTRPASPEGLDFGELPLEPRYMIVTTGLGFTPKISFAPCPTKMSPCPTFDVITIPPAQDPPSFLTHRPTTIHHPTSSAMPTPVSSPNWSPIDLPT